RTHERIIKKGGCHLFLTSLPAGDRLITGIEQQSTSLAGTDGMAYYRPPNNFLLGSEMVEGTGIDVAISLGGNEVFNRPLLLRRPPLLLIHGIAGSPATCDANVWQSNVSPLSTVIHRVDYQGSNTKGYEDNFWKLKNTISATLAD